DRCCSSSLAPIPLPLSGSGARAVPIPSDLFLSPDRTETDARAYLASLGFQNQAIVDEQFQAMADDIAVRQALGRIAGARLAVASQLSDLAVVIVGRALRVVTQQALESVSGVELPGAFAVIAMGKLGGHELNYSSDIDLLYVFEQAGGGDVGTRDLFQRMARM